MRATTMARRAEEAGELLFIDYWNSLVGVGQFFAGRPESSIWDSAPGDWTEW